MKLQLVASMTFKINLETKLTTMKKRKKHGGRDPEQKKDSDFDVGFVLS